MTFAHPQILWLLAISVPLLSLFLWWAWRKKQKLIGEFVRSRLLAHLTVGVSRRLQQVRLVLLVAAVGFLFLTLARPQWGFSWEEARQRGLDIVVAIDTSRSMLAEDIAPNRLQRAKLAALDLMQLARRDRLGLVAFAGTAFLQCPLTLDDEAFRQSVQLLDTGIIPQGGTVVTEAIQTAVQAFKKEEDNHKILVLFTDGEDHEPGAVDAAQEAHRAGIRIFTVGVGTPNGELLRERDERGRIHYLKDDQGNPVKSRLNETLLQQIASAAGGFYLPLRGADTINTLYERGLEPLPRSEIASKLVKRFHERYQWPLLAAILLLIAELFVPDRKRVSRPARSARALETAAAALLFAAAAAPVVHASPATALDAYQNQHYDRARAEYERLLERRPEDHRLRFNAGASAYQLKDYERAAEHFEHALRSPDLQLQQQAYYNLGHSLFRQGEQRPSPQEKIPLWEQSLEHFLSAAKLDPADHDAKFNAEYVKKRLEELKQQQQEQKKQQPQQKQEQSSSQDNQQSQKQESSDDQQKPDQQQQQDQTSSQDQQRQSANQQQEQPPPDPQPQQSQKQENQQEQEEKQPGGQAQPRNPMDSPPNDPASGDAQPLAPGQMTREQAERLLESQRGEEKAMLFVPQGKTDQRSRVFKDW